MDSSRASEWRSCLGVAVLVERCIKFGLAFVVIVFAGVSQAQVDMGYSVWKSAESEACPETITFLGPEEYLIESGDQMVTKAYKLKRYRKTDFFIFHQRTTANNDAANCQGVKGRKVGTRIKAYARFDDTSSVMRLYAEPDDNAAIEVVFYKQVPNQPSPATQEAVEAIANEVK